MTKLSDLQQQAHAATPVPASVKVSSEWTDTDMWTVLRVLKGAGISPNDLPRYTAVAEQYKLKHGSLSGWLPNGGGSAQAIYREHFKRDQASRKQARQELEAMGHRSIWPTYRNVKEMLLEAHERAFDAKEDRPSGRDILRGLHPDKEVVVTFAKRVPKKHTRRALGELQDHPTSKRLDKQCMRTARDISSIAGSTMAGSVAELYMRADVAKRLEQQDELAQQVAKLQAQVCELQALTAASEKRHEVTEAGGHWHDIATRMRAEGASYGQIAAVTGQGRSTVSKYLLRQMK
ncbi:hypothetical protein V476_19095 [Pseudomonas syringae KCTC 12500]|uniref:hypothetical protein n=1 Tax=Pseudomonas syringae TaxID=317 RepID=UPI0004698FDC|nr:hypothetical protein [Pseudomonas syringae]KMY03125.1 hypothetical protein V476_19095 [Pseudomonas syringae KCTC 12500]POR86038.1 hypothetical protein BKM21_10105 [Pseudomonas syringae pv. syringae]